MRLINFDYSHLLGFKSKPKAEMVPRRSGPRRSRKFKQRQAKYEAWDSRNQNYALVALLPGPRLLWGSLRRKGLGIS